MLTYLACDGFELVRRDKTPNGCMFDEKLNEMANGKRKDSDTRDQRIKYDEMGSPLT